MKTLFIKFKTTGKVYQFEKPEKEKLKEGDKVVVETDQGAEIGTVLAIKRKKPESEIMGRVRRFTEEDEAKLIKLEPPAQETKNFCREKIQELGLSMKLLDVEISLDEKKITFYFVAEERVDFRDLLSILIARYHKSIRLQQLGPRDAAKALGGFGCCGRPVCCRTFLENMESVTVDLAKEQDLQAVGTSKITGLCGKLMCCLAYEAEEYQEMRKKLPGLGKKIKTEKGTGVVIAQNVLSQSVLVRLEDRSKIEVRVKGESKK